MVSTFYKMSNSFIQQIKNSIPFESNIQQKDSYIDIEIYQTLPFHSSYPEFLNADNATSRMKSSLFRKKQKTIYLYSSLEETLEEIKSQIDAHLKTRLTATCPLCYVDANKRTIFRISCPKCAGNWCNVCYLKLIRKSAIYNNSLKCPCCQSLLERTSFMEIITPS